MKYKDLQPKLEEFKALPDDLTARLNFAVPPQLEIICAECGHSYSVPLSWDDIDLELSSGRHTPEDDYQIIVKACSNCSQEESDEEEDGL